MIINCPRCGVELDLPDSLYEEGMHLKCDVCGAPFLMRRGHAVERRNDVPARIPLPQNRRTESEPQPATPPAEAVSSFERIQQQFREWLASAPWTVQFPAVYVGMFGLLLALVNLITSKFPVSLILWAVIAGIAMIINRTLVRNNLVRWLLVGWGSFCLLVLVFRLMGAASKDFAWVWPFLGSFAAVAILLVLKPSREWYARGPAVSTSKNPQMLNRVVAVSLVLAFVANAIIYFGYNATLKDMRRFRNGGESHDYGIPTSFASPDAAVRSALSNVRSRYKSSLSRLGLRESYFDETNGICDLMLLDVGTWTKYQIVYYRSTDQIEWPRSMPKQVAQSLMQDRLIIHKYESTLGAGGR